MPTFNVPSTQLTANTRMTSPGVQVGADFGGATLTLVDTNGQWPATADDTRHVKIWGLQQSTDGGSSWQWGPVFSGNPEGSTDPADRVGPNGVDYWMAFGHRNRSGGMPSMSISSSQIVGLASVRLRLAIETDAPVRLGAQIVTS